MERLLVRELKALAVEEVGDDDLGLRPDGNPLARPVDEVLLQRAPLHFDGRGGVEEVGHARSGLGVGDAREAPKVLQLALVQQHHALLLTREGRVQKLTGQESARIGHDHKRRSELTSLRLVDRDGIGELQDGRPVVAAEFPFWEVIRDPALRPELDVESAQWDLSAIALERPRPRRRSRRWRRTR